MEHRVKRNGLLALSPLLVMMLLFLVLGTTLGGFADIPLLVVFICTSAYALWTLRGMPFGKRLTVFSRGAGEPNLLLMEWIFVMAGAFAASAKGMGAVEAAVNLTLGLLPAGMLLPGLFLSACFISLAIGTSVGTIVALTPIAAGVATQSEMSVALTVAAVVSGAFFGDNLSFISDTTVAATQSQGCRMSDKFKTNFWIALPAAVVTFFVYMWLSREATPIEALGVVDFWKIVPYLVVLIAALLGMNVLVVLCVGVVLSGVIGLIGGDYTLATWLAAVCTGIGGMAELILISMMAGGLLSVIRRGGGITYLLRALTKRVHTPRGAQLSIALLVSVCNLYTANNTVAILSVGSLARDIAERFHISPKRAASILDTFSCCIQGLIPYGAQLLMAAGLSALSPTRIVPHLCYPLLLGVSALVFILIQKKGSPQAG